MTPAKVLAAFGGQSPRANLKAAQRRAAGSANRGGESRAAVKTIRSVVLAGTTAEPKCRRVLRDRMTFNQERVLPWISQQQQLRLLRSRLN